MSKKSRKNRDDRPQDEPEVESALSGEETIGAETPGGEDAVFGDVPTTEEILETPETTETDETMPAEDAGEVSGGLPEAVPGEALAGEAPLGEVPALPLVLEAILFASQKAVTPKELATHLRNAAAAEPSSVAAAYARIREPDVAAALVDLQAEVADAGRAYQVRETATGWILSSGPGFAPWLRALYPEAKPTRLSPSALETLAIIAYRQPITRADMEAVRGVSVDGVMQTLLDRGLVRIAGRAELAGRPLLYATTQFFLDHFGLRNLDELPNAAELRNIPLPQAERAEESAENPGEGDAVATAGAPELPLAENANGEEAGVLETVEVTEIIEVRESVVFEEIAADAEEVREPQEEEPSGHPESEH